MIKHIVFHILAWAGVSAVMALFGQSQYIKDGGTMPGEGTVLSSLDSLNHLPNSAIARTGTVLYVNSMDMIYVNKVGGWTSFYDKFVALGGSYSNPSWIASLAYNKISGAPSLSTVATTGSYSDLSNKPSLSNVATSGAYSDLSGKPTLSTVAATGAYNDLTGKPTIPTVPTNISSFTNDANYLTDITAAQIKSVIGGLPYFNSGTTSSGIATFYLTSDKTLSGTALYTNTPHINPIANGNLSFTYDWTLSGDKKTLTITVRNAVATSVALIGLTILAAPANVTNGTSVSVYCFGN